MDNNIKSFLNSALTNIGAFIPKSSKDADIVVDATFCVRNLAKIGAKYTEWDKLFKSINNLITLSVGNKHYERVYATMNIVFGYMAQYYKASENVFKQIRLENALRNYWIAATQNPIQKMLYKFMSMKRISKQTSR